MIKKLYAVDESGKPVPGAVFTFTFTGSDGTVWIAAAFEGGQSGSVSLDTSMHPGLFDSEKHITVTAPGYANAGTDAGIVPDSWQFIMPVNPSMVPALTLGALLTIGAVVAYNSTGKKKKIGKFNVKDDLLPFVVPAAVVIGGFVIYNKLFGQSPQDKARDAALANDIANAAAIEAPRMLDSEIAATANALVEDLTYSHPFGDSSQQQDAAHQLTKPGTTADLLRLIKQYGKHLITYFGIPAGSFTLEETVTRKMDADIIAEINKYYDAQGMNFNF